MSNDQSNEISTAGGGEFMLFGVRVVVDSMRKSVSLNNLSQYHHRLDSSPVKHLAGNLTGNIFSGYLSADDAVHRSSSTAAATTVINRERKRGVPWTEEEHKLFLLGLEKVGKGDWRGISRTFVKTRTPTQVASHAQKYFLRRTNLNRRRRRSSLFDITTDSVVTKSMINQTSAENTVVATESIQANPEMSTVNFTVASPSSSLSPICSNHNTLAPQLVSTPASCNELMDTNSSCYPSPMSLNLSLSLSTEASSRNSGFQVSNRDGVISAA